VSAIVVFPGQGAQRNGMARDFYDGFVVARQVFEAASEALDLDMARLCFTDDPRLHLTAFTQPAILTAEIAMFRVLCTEFGLEATRFGGHSLGEYTALVAAGALTLVDAVCVVHARGQRMQSAVPAGEGAMAAIIQPELHLDTVAGSLTGLTVDIANHNAPNQVVISGAAADINTALERYQRTEAGRQARTRALAVSAPFHSRLMAPIEADFHARLKEIAWNGPPSARVTSNATGQMHDGSVSGLTERLTAQISGTVRWVDNMHTLLAASPARIIEIGPGRPLRGFFRTMGSALGDRPLDAITNLVSARRALGH
jgi:malonyl CoA-acyl carrier protein transacylase